MPRPKKTEAEKRLRREIYATSAEWDAVKVVAEAEGVSVSRLLLSRARSSAAPSGRRTRLPLQLARLQSELETVAAEILPETPGAALILARLSGIEKQLSDLAHVAAS